MKEAKIKLKKGVSYFKLAYKMGTKKKKETW